MSEPRKSLLLIADISGYTQFMLNNDISIQHSAEIIKNLLETIVSSIEFPLTLSKFEGDAAFMYALKGDDWDEVKKDVSFKLHSFFELFHQKIQELASSTECACGGCSHIRKLRLKLIIHSGEALLQTIHNSDELAGVDVILLHRLLKNSLKSDQYILMTKSACDDLHVEHLGELCRVEEKYDVGTVECFVHSFSSDEVVCLPWWKRLVRIFG